MSDRYPIEAFPDLQLPGFNNKATLWDIVHDDNDWQPVLSLSIYSPSQENPDAIDVLTTIRTEQTETHPHVISTPTGRFPPTFQLPLLESRRTVLQGELACVEFNDVSVDNFRALASFSPSLAPIPGEDPLAFLSQEQLSRKLGLGPEIQTISNSGAIGTISLSKVVAGFSYAADSEKDGTPLWEPLIMYGGVVMLPDRLALPEETTAYRKIGWTVLDNFLEGQSTKQAELLVPNIDSADEATVCVRGLCLDTTTVVSRHASLRSHLGLI